MRDLILTASLCGAALESAIVRSLLLRSVALPCFAAFLVSDILFTVGMTAVYLRGSDWLSRDYLRAYALAEPAVLALLVLGAIEALGTITYRVAALAALCIIATAAAAQGGPVALRVALLGSLSIALAISLTDRWRLHAALMLGFLLSDVVCSLAIALGETGTLRPGAFLVFGQLAPLVGWCVWGDRLAPVDSARWRPSPSPSIYR